jgi:hypothetical protein
MSWAAVGKLALKALPYLGTAVGSVALGSVVGNSSARNATDSESADGYLKGLFSSVGEENVENRTFNKEEAALNRQFQHDEAALQRSWYEEMSNSAYRRATYDMQQAGINPILAYSQGGAAAATSGVPAGSAASYNVGGGDTLSSVISSVADLVSAINGSGRRVSNTKAIGFKG